MKESQFWQSVVEKYPRNMKREQDIRAHAKDEADLVRMLKSFDAELMRRLKSDVDEKFRREVFNLTGCDPYSDEEMLLDQKLDHLLDCIR